MKIIPVYVIIFILISGIIFPTGSTLLNYAFAEESIPSWLKFNAKLWANNELSDKEFMNAIKYLFEKKIIISESIVVIESKQAIGANITLNDDNFFSTAKNAIAGWIGEIQKDPTANLIVKSTLPIIPVVGPLLSNLYDNVEGTPVEKNQKMLELLKEYQNMNEEGLKKSFTKLDENKEAIKNNTYKLDQVLADTKQILEITTDTNVRVQSLEAQIHLVLKKLDTISIGKSTPEVSPELKNQLSEITGLASELVADPNSGAEFNTSQLEAVAKSYLLQEDFNSAIKIYDKILQQDSKNHSALIEKAWSLYDLEKYFEAKAEFDKFLIIYPQDSEGWDGKGWSALELGDIDETKNAFTESLKIDSSNADAIAGLGWAYLEEENCEMAELQFFKALNIEEGNIDAIEGLDIINEYGC
jgi:tetratricopeptide (TPR) repeat protein